jgi:glucose-6-phosphate 3-dehydrogenase
MKLGIIGAGKIAAMHMAAVRANPDAFLVGVYDVSDDAARAAAQRFACKAFSTPEALYPCVDGVIIATPNHTHAEIAVEAMQHHRHVLCEKPMATTIAQATEMARVAALSDLACYVGFNYRYLFGLIRVSGGWQDKDSGRRSETG